MLINYILEEILGDRKALWMSADGHMLLFASFNDTLVEEYKFSWYRVNQEDRLYPQIRSLRYPKVRLAPVSPSPTPSHSIKPMYSFHFRLGQGTPK